MAVSFDSIITSLFEGTDQNIPLKRGRRFNSNNDRVSLIPKKFMTIPIDEDVFELPLLAFSDFREMLKNHILCDTIVAELCCNGYTSAFKSLDAIMRDVLSVKFSQNLYQIQLPSSPNLYYSTFGTVFNSDLKPLMMLSWIMEKRVNGNGQIIYYYKRPILRLDPCTLKIKEDAVQSFLSNKMLLSTLKASVIAPYCYDPHTQFSFTQENTFSVKIEIDECPFTVKGIDLPSISVTNESLLQLVTDHIDDMIQ